MDPKTWWFVAGFAVGTVASMTVFGLWSMLNKKTNA